MIEDLEARLRELGDLLALDDRTLVDDVGAAIATPADQRRGLPDWLRVAAVVLAIVIAGVLAIPSSRDAVAGWFGFDRVTIKREDPTATTTAPTTATTPGSRATSTTTGAPTSVPSPIDETAVSADGQTVLVGTIDGRLDDTLITKTISVDATVTPVDVDGDPGVWLDEPHELMIERGGQVVTERIAGKTLLWQDGDVLWRVEGFDALSDALAFARSR